MIFIFFFMKMITKSTNYEFMSKIEFFNIYHKKKKNTKLYRRAKI